MDRQIVYPGQIPLETDLLNTNKSAMVAIAKLSQAIFGSSSFVNGFACTPNSPADMTVFAAAGEVYSLQNIDNSAYSSIAADTTHQILKQGSTLSSTQLSCPAPGIGGFSINYLVQVAFNEADTNTSVLPYYNASNPTQAWAGMNNNGLAQATLRQNGVTVSVKAGAAAATGTQTTPAPDSGYIGLWVVTVANGQTSITSANISQYSGAPFIPQAGAASNAINSVYTKSVAGNTDVTLTAQEAAYPIINLTGALTGNINVIVPATTHQWIINNGTSGAFSVTVKTQAGTGVIMPSNASMVLYCNGTNVVSAGSGGSSVFTKTEFTATAGQTVFVVSYTVGNVFVTRNGVMVPFTGTNGSSITLTTPANLNDTVDVYALNSFSVANALMLSGGTLNGLLVESVGAAIASAATLNLTGATGNALHVTGTTTVTGVTMTAGQRMMLIFDGALTLTHNSTTNNLPGAASILTQAGDRAIYWNDGATTYCIAYVPATGSQQFNALGLRNRAINGAMEHAQWSTTSTVSAGTSVPTASAGYPCVDRFFVYSTGANVVASQVSSGANKRLQIAGAASVTAVGVGQRMEALYTKDLAGSTCTFSVKIANSLLTTVTWTAYYANSADTFGTIGTPTKTQIATGTFTVSSVEAQYAAQIAIPAGATTGIEIVLTVGAQTSGTWTIGEWQFEKGAIASPIFEYFRPDELQLCKKYLPSFTIVAAFNHIGQCYSTTAAAFNFPFTHPTRVAPTGISIPSGTPVAYNSSGGNAGGTAVFNSASTDHGTVAVTGATGLVAGNASSIGTTGGTATILFTGCEIP